MSSATFMKRKFSGRVWDGKVIQAASKTFYYDASSQRFEPCQVFFTWSGVNEYFGIRRVTDQRSVPDLSTLPVSSIYDLFVNFSNGSDIAGTTLPLVHSLVSELGSPLTLRGISKMLSLMNGIQPNRTHGTFEWFAGNALCDRDQRCFSTIVQPRQRSLAESLNLKSIILGMPSDSGIFYHAPHYEEGIHKLYGFFEGIGSPNVRQQTDNYLMDLRNTDDIGQATSEVLSNFYSAAQSIVEPYVSLVSFRLREDEAGSGFYNSEDWTMRSDTRTVRSERTEDSERPLATAKLPLFGTEDLKLLNHYVQCAE